MRYPLAQSNSADSAQGGGALLEMWAYEACRLFRDRLVGTKAQEKFDTILSSVVQSDWSVDLSSLQREGKPLYVTWGASAGKGDALRAQFGRSLGRLSSADMQETVAKGVLAYGELSRP